MSLGIAFAAVVIIAIAGFVIELVSGAKLNSRLTRRKGGALADKLLARRLVRPDTILYADGGYLAMFELSAPDAGAFDDASLQRTTEGIASALGAISDRFIVHLRERHVRVSEYAVPKAYPDPVSEWLDRGRARFFMGGNTFTTRRVLSLKWLPRSSMDSRIAKVVERRSDQSAGPTDLEQFDRDVENAVAFLRSYARVRRLGSREDSIDGLRVERNEMLEQLAYEISGRERKVSAPRSLVALNSLLSEPMRGGSDVRIGEYEVAIVVIKSFIPDLEPLALARLRQLTASYDLVMRWMPLSPSESRKSLKEAHNEWRVKASENSTMGDPYAQEMLDEASAASGLASGGQRFGLLSPFIVLRARTRREVDSLASEAMQILDELGYSAFIASRTAEDDLFATFSGDGYHGVRRYQMHVGNLADMFSLHEQSSGPRSLGVPSLPEDSPPMMYGVAGRGAENVLYRFTPSTDPPDLLNYFGVGRPGSGKSVALAQMALSFYSRVPLAGATTLDTGRSMYRLARFIGAPYYDLLKPGSVLGFALFSDVENEVLRRDLAEILIEMVELQGVAVTPSRRAAIDTGLETMTTLPPNLRNMTSFVSHVQDPEGLLRPALALYAKDGPLGPTLDSVADTFALSRFSVVELGQLWDMPEKYLIPTLRVMFWKITNGVRRLRVDEKNQNIYWLYQIDEASRILRYPSGQKFVQDLLLLGRREKFVIGQWSQFVRHFSASGIWMDIDGACPTRFYFADASATDAGSSEVRVGERPYDYYANAGLPDHGIVQLPKIARHSVLLHQPTVQEVVELSFRLDRAWLAVIGRTSTQQNDWLDEMILRFPQTWRTEVLRSEGVPQDQIDEFLTIVSAHERMHADAASPDQPQLVSSP